MIELYIGFRALLFYFLTAASFALLLRKNVPVPREVFRKTLHFIQDGLDTMTCPLAAAVIIIPLVLLLGG